MRVFKYELAPYGQTDVEMPAGTVLSFGLQGTTPVVWALVDVETPAAIRRLRVLYTGDSPRDGSTYIGTAMLVNEASIIPVLVLHCFEDPR